MDNSLNYRVSSRMITTFHWEKWTSEILTMVNWLTVDLSNRSHVDRQTKAECGRFWSDQDDSRRVLYSIITVFSVVFVEFSFTETVQNNCNIDYISNIPAWNSDSVDIIEINKNHYCSWSILVFIFVFVYFYYCICIA